VRQRRSERMVTVLDVRCARAHAIGRRGVSACRRV
jgi:hypothetical protein